MGRYPGAVRIELKATEMFGNQIKLKASQPAFVIKVVRLARRIRDPYGLAVIISQHLSTRIFVPYKRRVIWFRRLGIDFGQIIDTMALSLMISDDPT